MDAEIRDLAATPRGKRVLIVEDDALVGESTLILLEFMGHEPRLAMNGEQALQVAHEFKPEFVLCDISLPGEMNGYAVAKALREEPAFNKTLVVALSGYSHKQAIDQAAAAGFDRYFVKPLSAETLEELLAREG